MDGMGLSRDAIWQGGVWSPMSWWSHILLRWLRWSLLVLWQKTCVYLSLCKGGSLSSEWMCCCSHLARFLLPRSVKYRPPILQKETLREVESSHYWRPYLSMSMIMLSRAVSMLSFLSPSLLQGQCIFSSWPDWSVCCMQRRRANIEIRHSQKILPH